MTGKEEREALVAVVREHARRLDEYANWSGPVAPWQPGTWLEMAKDITRLADALAAARGEAIAEPADLQSWAQEVERAAVNRALDAVNLHAMNGDTLAMMRARDAIRAEFGDTP